MTAQEVEGLYLEHRQYLHMLACAWCDTEQDREDVVADVFAKLFGVTIRPVTRAYLATMLANLCRDRWRTSHMTAVKDPFRARRAVTLSEAQGNSTLLIDEVLGFRRVCFTEPQSLDPVDALLQGEQSADLKAIIQDALDAVAVAHPLSAAVYFIHAYRHQIEIPRAYRERSLYSRVVEQEHGVTSKAVKSRIWRARSFLKRYLLEQYPVAMREYFGRCPGDRAGR